MKRLFFVRHGQTVMNVDQLFAGQTETALTEDGKRQAITAGQRVKETLPLIDLIITSTLERTQTTAALIAQEIGYPLERIEASSVFIERNFGILEGTSSSDFFKEHPYAHIDVTKDAETIEQLQKRAKLGLD